MKRLSVLTWFLIRDLYRSLWGILPLSTAVAFGLIAFEYGMGQAQFFVVAGVANGAIGLLCGLLLAGRANRAAFYPILARLRSRNVLLTAICGASLLIATALAVLVAAANLVVGRLTLSFPSALWIVPTWLPLWLLMATLALPLSTLVGRQGSHVLGYVLLTAFLVLNEQNTWIFSQRFAPVFRAVSLILWPVNTLLTQAAGGVGMVAPTGWPGH